jgi:hypothetical protein
MPYTKRLIDLSKVPEDQREALIHMIEHHNGLVTDVGEDMTSILGKDPEVKAEMVGLFKQFKKVAHFLQSHRFNALTWMGLAYLLIQNAETLGIDLKLVGKLVNAILSAHAGG